MKATGRGRYSRTNVDASGFPVAYMVTKKRVRGLRTGDLVRACVPKGKKAGTHFGRVAVRATGSFNIRTQEELLQGIHAKYCTLIQRTDGYGYPVRAALPPRPEGTGLPRGETR